MKNAEVPSKSPHTLPLASTDGLNNIASNTSGHLPVRPPPQKRTVTLDISHGRSFSVSSDTMVPETPDRDFRRTNIPRRGTHVAVVELSYLDILKAIFTGAKVLKRKLAAKVEWVDPSEDRIQVGSTHPD